MNPMSTKFNSPTEAIHAPPMARINAAYVYGDSTRPCMQGIIVGQPIASARHQVSALPTWSTKARTATKNGHEAATISMKASESDVNAKLPRHRLVAKVAASRKILSPIFGDFSCSSVNKPKPSIVITERKAQASI
eukprot:scaffold364_cov401-Prasinococcus_capsulatus_cf.AAC.9